MAEAPAFAEATADGVLGGMFAFDGRAALGVSLGDAHGLQVGVEDARELGGHVEEKAITVPFGQVMAQVLGKIPPQGELPSKGEGRRSKVEEDPAAGAAPPELGASA